MICEFRVKFDSLERQWCYQCKNKEGIRKGSQILKGIIDKQMSNDTEAQFWLVHAK